MNTESVNCRKVEFGKMERVGDFCFAEDLTWLYMWTPGANGPDAIRIVRTEAEARKSDRRWIWDGNEQAPTLLPSLLTPEWHGYFRAGRMESC